MSRFNDSLLPTLGAAPLLRASSCRLALQPEKPPGKRSPQLLCLAGPRDSVQRLSLDLERSSQLNQPEHFCSDKTAFGGKGVAVFIVFLKRGKHCLVASAYDSRQNLGSLGTSEKCCPAALIPAVPCHRVLADTAVTLHIISTKNVKRIGN